MVKIQNYLKIRILISQFNSDTPQFEHGSYSYFIKADVSGLIGVVSATVEDPSVPLNYSFETSDEILRDSLGDPNNGVLVLTSTLPPNIYEGKMIAQNGVTEDIASAAVLITVAPEESCPTSNVTTIEKVLVVKELKEEEAHPNIMASNVLNCEYIINEQWPPNTNYFEVDSKTRSIKSRKFDRESPIFANESIPQFRITLKLVCPLKSPRISVNDQNLSYVKVNDISYSLDTTILSVIIEDINDNPPKFIKPDRDLVLGYPSTEIAQKLQPEFLYQVKAIDIDDGFNAEISYQIDQNSHFTIDRKTGVIVPLSYAMLDVRSTTLVVRAIDRDAGDGSLFSSVKIKVVKLLENHLVSILYENNRKLSYDEILKEIQQESMMNLMALKMTTIPKMYNSSDYVQVEYEQTTIVHIIGYAFMINESPMPSERILGILSPLEGILNLTVQSYSDTLDICDVIAEKNKEDLYKILFIIFSSILGSVIVIIVVVIILVYSYLIKPLQYQEEVESRSSSKLPEPDLTSSRPASKRHRRYQKSGEKRVSFGTSRRMNESNSFPITPVFDSEDDRKFSTSSNGSNNSESDDKRRETQNVQFQAFMKKFERLDGDGSDEKGLEVLHEEQIEK
uniref:CSON014406 protein n=1 Tax=Culicoides sonorensis TaxID=179676 RepID=A0A336LM70_CULSO